MNSDPNERMGCPQPGSCPCSPVHQTRAPLAGCVQKGPALHTLLHGESDEGNEVRDVCSDVISAVGYLRDSIDSADDENKSLAPLKYLYLMSAIADLTKALVTYLEPEDGGEPY